jgi:hypothetical protein
MLIYFIHILFLKVVFLIYQVLFGILKARRDRKRLEAINRRYFEFAQNRNRGFGETPKINPDNAFGFSQKLNPAQR